MLDPNKGRIVIVDPSAISYEGMRQFLTEGGYAALSQATGLEDALLQIEQLEPDLLIVGATFAEDESLEICREMSSRFPQVRLIVMSEFARDPLFQADAAYVGASACLPRQTSRNDYLDTVAAVLAGHQLFSREILAHAHQPIRLTEREHQVLRLIAEEKTDRQIADQLTVSINTVRKQSQRVLEKLQVHERREAVRRAKRRGLI